MTYAVILSGTMIGLNYEECASSLSLLSSFVEEFSPMLNVCMVDFIVEDVFAAHLGGQMGQELLEMGPEEVLALPRRLETGRWRESKGTIDGLMARLLEHSLERLGMVEEIEHKEEEDGILKNLDRIMGEKKMHEVVRFASSIQDLCESNPEVRRGCCCGLVTIITKIILLLAVKCGRLCRSGQWQGLPRADFE